MSGLLGYTFEGRYRIESLLGRGGMGAVYQALDVNSQRRVAVKILQGDGTNRRERFRREGQAAANLKHPGILRVHAIGEEQGYPYLVYELVEGCKELDDVLSGLPLRRRVELVRDAGRALGFAHQNGVVHRDVKPANLLVDAQGRLFVADFGLALLADTERMTRTGALLGTPTHMAPEQVNGEAHKSKPQVDVWALGVVLYQALTGELPFEAGDWMALAAKICSGDPERPSSLDGSVPRALEWVCLKCLEVDPARRYVDGAALADDLDAWLEGRPVAAGPRRGPKPGLAFAVGLLGVVGIGLTGLALRGERTVSGGPSQEERREARLAELEARNQRLRATQELNRLRYIEPSRRMPALEGWLEANAEHPLAGEARASYREAGWELPRAQLQAAPSKTIAYWRGPDRVVTCGYGVRVVEYWDISDVDHPVSLGRWAGKAGSLEEQNRPVYSGQGIGLLPDGRFVWGGEWDRTLRRGNLGTPGALEAWAMPKDYGTVRRLKVQGTPAGSLLFMLCDQSVRVTDPEAWPPEDLARVSGDGRGYLGALAVRPDGRQVAALMRRTSSHDSSEGDTLYVWDLDYAGGAIRGTLLRRKPLLNTMSYVTYSPDGRTLAVGLRRGLLYTLSLDPPGDWVEFGREDALLGRAHASSVDAVAWSNDGRLLYSLAEFKNRESTGVEQERRGEMVTWDVAKQKALRRVELSRPTQSVEVGEDGRLLLGLNSGVVQIWVGD